MRNVSIDEVTPGVLAIEKIKVAVVHLKALYRKRQQPGWRRSADQTRFEVVRHQRQLELLPGNLFRLYGFTGIGHRKYDEIGRLFENAEYRLAALHLPPPNRWPLVTDLATRYELGQMLQ
jgi:hypothetical protein